MCIRDRDESVSDSVLMEGAAYSNETDDLSVDAESDKAVEEADDDLCPVSYTHLDVYKRQVAIHAGVPADDLAG